MDTIAKPHFPCGKLPEDARLSRLLGLYPQRQDGLWMQRIKIQGGVLTAAQWASLADLSRQFTPETGIQLTTRQDVEFHNLSPEAVPRLQAALHKKGFTGLGACGDTLRNITVCPGSGICPDTPDLAGQAARVRQLLESLSEIYSLPRKFKISFSCCSQACAQPWINDLGFVARAPGQNVHVDLIGAGSLGARPATGIVLAENLTPADIPAVTRAALQLFIRHGDRKNRKKARLRHIRERVGDERFIAMLNEECSRDTAQKPSAVPSPAASVSATGCQPAAVLHFPFGTVTPEQAEAIAALVYIQEHTARLDNYHTIRFFSANPEQTAAAVDADSVLNGLTAGHDIAACPGTDFCSHALVNTYAAERQLRRSLPASEKRSIRISGCPNGCAHTAVAHIGLSGRTRKDDHGTSCEGFQIVTGGGLGKTADMARLHTAFVPTEEVAHVIAHIDERP